MGTSEKLKTVVTGFDFIVAFLVTTAFTLLALISRTTGLHLDEGAYLIYAKTKIFGDSKGFDKPTLFYPLNYILNQFGASHLEIQSYYAIYFFYIAAIAFALSWFIVAVAQTRGQRYKLLAILILTPFYVLNSTELMMETALMPLCTAGFICAWRASNRSSADRSPTAGLPFLFWLFIAILFKTTSIPAFFCLAFAYILVYQERRLYLPSVCNLLAVAIFGIICNNLSLHFLPGIREAGIFNWNDVIGPLKFLKRLLFIPSYIYTWLFFVGPVAFLTFKKYWPGGKKELIALFATKPESEKPLQWLTLVALFTLIVTVAFNPVSSYEIARYAYPTIWIGLMAMAIPLATYSWSVVLKPLLLNSLLTLTLVTTFAHRFSIWPTIIPREFFYSGCHVFQGTRLHGWMLLRRPQNENLCIFVNKKDGEQNYLLKQFFSEFTRAKLFDETTKSEFDACLEPKGFVRRQYADQKLCPTFCAAQKNFWSTCDAQPIVHGENTGDLINESCLP